MNPSCSCPRIASGHLCAGCDGQPPLLRPQILWQGNERTADFLPDASCAPSATWNHSHAWLRFRAVRPVACGVRLDASRSIAPWSACRTGRQRMALSAGSASHHHQKTAAAPVRVTAASAARKLREETSKKLSKHHQPLGDKNNPETKNARRW